jgi:phosphatidylglycerol:prolipoprotein diacylglycerol transferase
MLTGIARFLVEFVRRNPPVAFGFSNAQVASLGSIVVGIALMIWVSRRGTREEHEAVAVQKTA